MGATIPNLVSCNIAKNLHNVLHKIVNNFTTAAAAATTRVIITVKQFFINNKFNYYKNYNKQTTFRLSTLPSFYAGSGYRSLQHPAKVLSLEITRGRSQRTWLKEDRGRNRRAPEERSAGRNNSGG